MRMIGEVLKRNTPLAKLILSREEGVRGWVVCKRVTFKRNNPRRLIVNEIGSDGMRILAKTLKTNSTLVSLDLHCVYDRREGKVG